MRKRYIAESIKDKILFRIFPAFALVVSLVSIILPAWFTPLGNAVIHNVIIYQLFHMASSMLFILILVFPGRYTFYAIIGLMFSVYLPMEQADVFYSFLFYCLFLYSVYEMGLLDEFKRIKTVGILFFYIFIVFLQFLIYGADFFLANMFQYVVTFSILVITAALFFSLRTIEKIHAPEVIEEPKKGLALDLNTFERLTDREIIIICRILQNEKYDYIARTLGLSEITVKKAAGVIFKKMNCTDKFDFFGKYSNLAVVMGDKVFLTEKREETEILSEMVIKEKK
ncbi:MAG: LuxR C-terminal-related transcriptional regulator [Treponema sp.]|nr:LuxR C-terminal-related transcriptional regulator [Treponema sp.]